MISQYDGEVDDGAEWFGGGGGGSGGAECGLDDGLRGRHDKPRPGRH